ncbi:hypothetical protein [Geomonas sp.]|uniref:hypothetical protein n=1 Tax=Geomonas sp. TaxID=2651584 RepID=UPI002B460784|nr:hypothetical protein [Geomonas sp.]HJV34731.1 hypothetical protein [Geomonas sp.]
MKCQLLKTAMTLLLVLLLALAGCGGGGSASTPGATVTADALVTGVGWVYNNTAPDYFTSGATCLLTVNVYYDPSIAPAAIDSVTISSPAHWRWQIPASSSQFGTSSNGKPYLGGNIYYGMNPATMPLAGTWTFQLNLKNGQIATMQKKLHEPGSSADATHDYLYTGEDWTATGDASLYVAALGRFPASGYTLNYDPANGGTITSTGFSAVRSAFLAAQPHAYNMVCWLYDANKNYLGASPMEFSLQDHSRTNLIDGNGELAIEQSATFSSTPTSRSVDLSAVKYVRFAYFDGAQYAPQSYSRLDYRSISAQVVVNSGAVQ